MSNIYKQILMENVLDIIKKRGFYYIRTKVLYPDFIGPEYIIVTDDADIVKKHPKMAGMIIVSISKFESMAEEYNRFYAMRNDIETAENIDIGIGYQPDIRVKPKKLTALKFYCPLKVQREIQPTFDEDGEDEFFEDTEELSDFEALEYESEISDAIEAYQSEEEENRGIMAYLGDRKRFADKVYSIFPSVEKVGDKLMGVFTCQICGELDSYEYDELLQELRGQASDGYCEGLEQHEIHTSEGDIYVSFYDTCGAWDLMTEEEVKAAPESPSEDVSSHNHRRIQGSGERSHLQSKLYTRKLMEEHL